MLLTIPTLEKPTPPIFLFHPATHQRTPFMDII